jgi:hypothetical protein
MTDQNIQNPNAASYVDDYAPPADQSNQSDQPAQASAPMNDPRITPMPAAESGQVSQSLEDQNIFHLLGLEEATDDEKEAFLDELQQIIWEDFLENDVDLLLTEEEMVDFKKIENKPGLSDEDRQGEMVEFLEKLIPDLEKIMLEKALELKEEMMRERIMELLDLYKEEPENLKRVQHAQELVDDQQWRAAAEELNSIE